MSFKPAIHHEPAVLTQTCYAREPQSADVPGKAAPAGATGQEPPKEVEVAAALPYPKLQDNHNSHEVLQVPS